MVKRKKREGCSSSLGDRLLGEKIFKNQYIGTLMIFVHRGEGTQRENRPFNQGNSVKTLASKRRMHISFLEIGSKEVRIEQYFIHSIS